jgi:hypothetical protein
VCRAFRCTTGSLCPGPEQNWLRRCLRERYRKAVGVETNTGNGWKLWLCGLVTVLSVLKHLQPPSIPKHLQRHREHPQYPEYFKDIEEEVGNIYQGREGGPTTGLLGGLILALHPPVNSLIILWPLPRARPPRRRSPKVRGGVSRAICASSRVKHRTDDGSRNAQAWIARKGQCHRVPRRARPQSSEGFLPSARLARRTIGVRHGLESNRR